MALRNLNIEEMIGLSAQWLAEGPRKVLEKHRRTAGIVGDLGTAHEGLVKSQKSRQDSASLTAIVAKQKTIDVVFDRKARGTNLVLAGLAELADDEAQAGLFRDAQALLHPDGLSFINQNYSAEAGVAELTRHRLKESPQVGQLLASVKLPFQTTLADETETWLSAGQQLGQLESERLSLVDQSEEASVPPDQKTQSAARNRWIRVVRAMIDHISLDETPDTELRRLILRPVAEAEVRADARTNRAVSARTPATPSAPDQGDSD